MSYSPTHADASLAMLRANFAKLNQGHIFRFWDKLSSKQKTELLAQTSQVDLAEITRLAKAHLEENSQTSIDLTGLRPAPYIAQPHHGGDAKAWTHARDLGEAALRAGRVACFTVAGGQGTRLGFDGPKGAFPVTPVRGHSLFQVFAEKILVAGKRYGHAPHWFIMTSPANHAATVEFFSEHKFFGLEQSRVHFFPQGTMPAVDFQGQLLLEAPSRLALSPDGHGGSLRALMRSGCIELMREQGIDTLSYFQVDNPLVHCVNPAFVGFHLEAQSEMSSKMIPKRGPGEKVGNFCRDQQGRIIVIEYSDLPRKLAEEQTVEGKLRFLAGSIGIHLLDREFVARVGGGLDETCRLPFHRANKKIPTVDNAGQPISPGQPNGIKFEMFVFDALPFARNSIVVETERAEEFSPVKNATGEDSAPTCRADQLRQYARWLRDAGAPLTMDTSGLPDITLEISPRFGDDQSSVASSWRALQPKPKLVEGLVLE